jgi:hypothetical protein
VAVRDAARTGTLRSGDKGLEEIVNRWDQLLRYLCLHLGRDLGADVEMVVSREHLSDPVKRTRDMSTTLGTEYLLQGVLRIPNAAGDVRLVADLRSRRVTASVDLDPPSEGRPATRINWMVKQLKAAPDNAQVGASYRRRRSTSELLERVRGDPKLLLNPVHPTESPRWLTAALARDMDIKGGRGRGSFVSGMEELVRDFYHDVVQDLKAYVEPAPRIAPLPQPEPKPQPHPVEALAEAKEAAPKQEADQLPQPPTVERRAQAAPPSAAPPPAPLRSPIPPTSPGTFT